VFVAEDHNIIGGLGSAIAEVLGEKNPLPVKCHGVADIFTESGSVKDLLEKYNLDKEGIKNIVLEFLKRENE
jgi:transketolase